MALLSRDPERAVLIDVKLEGWASDLPTPSVSALSGLTKQLAESKVKTQQSGFESAASHHDRCKGLRPALPPAHTMVEVHRSYTAAVPQPTLEAYICLGGWPPVWGVFTYST